MSLAIYIMLIVDGDIDLVETILNHPTTEEFDANYFPPSINPGVVPAKMNALYLAILEGELAIVQTLVNNHGADSSLAYTPNAPGFSSWDSAVGYAEERARANAGDRNRQAIAGLHGRNTLGGLGP